MAWQITIMRRFATVASVAAIAAAAATHNVGLGLCSLTALATVWAASYER